MDATQYHIRVLQIYMALGSVLMLICFYGMWDIRRTRRTMREEFTRLVESIRDRFTKS